MCTHTVYIENTMPTSPTPPTGAKRVGVREFRTHLTEYLRQAQQGTPILITSHDQVIAEVRPPPAQAQPKRRPGALRGKIWMAPDFDALPEDILAAMEE